MSTSGVTLVGFAVKEEAGFFRRLTIGRADVQMLLTGMGRYNAETSVLAALERCKVKSVLSSGFAGGLRPGLASGTVVFATEEPELGAALQGAGAQPARFHCAARVATTAGQKRAMRATTGADAVEMESRWICEACRKQGIPSATVRVVLDAAEQDLPLDFNSLMTPDWKLSSRKLALALLRGPGKIGALLRLQKQSAQAASFLAEVLVRVL
jgi:adenosylhomocysteine nucleosidase